MKIVVIGGTGLIGSKVVAILKHRGHEAVAASPNNGVNTITGEGLAEAFTGTDVVIDLANSPSFEDKAVLEFFETAGRNIAAAEKAAGVKHHVALSVVGTGRVQDSGYLRAKLAQEKLIKASPIPYTIVHSTQFFEFMGAIAASGAKGETIHLSTGMMQPIASDDVAAQVAEAALGAPVNGTVEIAGPEKFRLCDVVQRYMRYMNDNREVVADPQARYFGAVIDHKSLMPDSGARIGKVSFENWLAQQRKTA